MTIIIKQWVNTITVKYTKKYTLNVNLSGASLSHFMLFQNTKHELKLTKLQKCTVWKEGAL